MRIIQINDLRPGTILGKTLFDEHGQILLNAGVELTENYIAALRAKGYDRIYVRDPEAGVEPELQEDLPPKLRSRALQAMNMSYEAIGKELQTFRQMSINDAKTVCNSKTVQDLMGPEGPLAHMTTLVDRIIEEVMNHSTVAGLTSIKSKNTVLYEHSIDVCVVALMLGRGIGQPQARLRQLAMGCLLHDIGMLFIDKRLPETARIMQHTQLGYELLKASPDKEILAPHVAYEHHEHQDGSGLPRGLKGGNTVNRNRGLKPPIPTLVGEIAAVANTYDNLLTGTLKRAPLSTPDTLATLREMAGTQLNAEVVNAFLRMVTVFPVGMEVVVTTGRYKSFSGTVVRVNDGRLDRPVIVLTRDAQGNTISPVEIDVAAESNVQLRPAGSGR